MRISLHFPQETKIEQNTTKTTHPKRLEAKIAKETEREPLRISETPKTKDKKQIIVNNGELSFGTKRREDIEIALDDISSKIFELIVQINKF